MRLPDATLRAPSVETRGKARADATTAATPPGPHGGSTEPALRPNDRLRTGDVDDEAWMRALGFGLVLTVLTAGAASAQAPGAPPPAVGVVKVTRHPVTETEQFIGRIQAVDRVDVVARVSAFLDQVLFADGQEVKKGDLLYRLEQPPFTADVEGKKGALETIQAQLVNANLTLQRAQTLLNTPAGQQSTVDAARANQGNLQGQLLTAQAALATSQINLGYTTIMSPIDGKIGRTNVTAGNVVGPGSGVLVTVVGQDPMYVVFPISVRAALDLRARYAAKGGLDALRIKIVLPDGRTYGEVGKLTFVDNTVATSTDTLTLRGTIGNPRLAQPNTSANLRELTDGEFVTVLLEGVEPVELLAIPRAAVLTDQSGDYVYAVGDDNKAARTPVKLGQSTPTEASVLTGLSEGQTIIVDGLQRVRPGQAVSPGPAPPGATDAARKAAP